MSRWLLGLNLEHLVPEFSARSVDGEQLLRLESTELKVGSVCARMHAPEIQYRSTSSLTHSHFLCFSQALGVTSSQDRALLKKRIKDLRVTMEKAKRNREKLEKQLLRRQDSEMQQKEAP